MCCVVACVNVTLVIQLTFFLADEAGGGRRRKRIRRQREGRRSGRGWQSRHLERDEGCGGEGDAARPGRFEVVNAVPQSVPGNIKLFIFLYFSLPVPVAVVGFKPSTLR